MYSSSLGIKTKEFSWQYNLEERIKIVERDLCLTLGDGQPLEVFKVGTSNPWGTGVLQTLRTTFGALPSS